MVELIKQFGINPDKWIRLKEINENTILERLGFSFRNYQEKIDLYMS